ncbi:hypothetical protein NDU88_001178, partial [Pleurodeles waltl]
RHHFPFPFNRVTLKCTLRHIPILRLSHRVTHTHLLTQDTITNLWRRGGIVTRNFIFQPFRPSFLTSLTVNVDFIPPRSL